MPGSLSARRRILAVSAGGFCGTLTRYLVSICITGWLGKSWPYDLLLINITGALLLAFVTTLADATFLVGPTRRLFINVGFLGAYTTFSSFALSSDILLQGGEWLPAFLFLVVSLIGGALAILLGDRMGFWCASKVRGAIARPQVTRKLTQPLNVPVAQQHMRTDHLDVQDDLLLPDEDHTHQIRQGRSDR
ncbi:MAG TPA: CrcB family protein [Ktedonobacteraceae bacterium]|jgi:CrcB protein|nr:CrcB family protein [Ktedonobacteraceae bacterium]